jgi:oxygen-independent coproporphyrinogen-3 oxidase
MRAEYLRKSVDGHALLPFVYCYPPRTAYIEDEAPRDLRAVWSQDAERDRDLNVYVHIPFCRYRCSFCNLYTVTTPTPDGELFENYCAAIERDLAFLAPSLSGRRVRSVFIGGGTPFAIGVDRLVRLLAALAQTFPDLADTAEEVSVEASPDTVLEVGDSLRKLVEAGVNRVSIGAQSFDARELQQAGRARAGPEVIQASLNRLRAAGVSNIGIDLIVGLEGQTQDSLMRSLDRVTDFLPETVSLYPLSPRRGTRLGRNLEPILASHRTLTGRIEAASSRLLGSGYERQTSVQFKLPGRGGLLQKSLYFSGVSVLGLGSGARSYTATVDYLTGGGSARNREGLSSYLEGAGAAGARTGVRITADEAERRTIILGLHDLDLDSLPRGTDGSVKEPYDSVFKTCVRLGLMKRDGRRLKLTERGFLHRDVICWSLFSETALQRHSSRGAEYADLQRYVPVLSDRRSREAAPNATAETVL